MDYTEIQCSDPYCPNGSCSGCKNGKMWCEDPSCHPYCKNCQAPDDADKWGYFMIVLIVFGLFLLLAVIWFTLIVPHRDKIDKNTIT